MKILIGYDGSNCARSALQDLVRAGLPGKAQARILSVAEHGAGIQSAKEMAEEAAMILRVWFPGWEIETTAASGSPARRLVEVADEWQPSLLIVGSHGRSAFGRFLLGSVSHKLVAEARCPVRVARQAPEAGVGAPRFIVATDGSEAATEALRYAAQRQWPAGTEAVVVTAVSSHPPSHPESDADYHETAAMQVAEWRARRLAEATQTAEEGASILREQGIQATTLVDTAPVHQLIASKAEHWAADCVFLGATGAGKAHASGLGSAAMHIVMRAPCSVEVIR